jgi:hypothetical protein
MLQENILEFYAVSVGHAASAARLQSHPSRAGPKESRESR